MSQLVALVLPGVDSTGRALSQDDLNRRLESGRLLLGHVLDNPMVLAVAGSASVLVAGYPAVSRCWVVFTMVQCSDDQWLELKAAGRKMSAVWGVGVGLVGPYGYQEV